MSIRRFQKILANKKSLVPMGEGQISIEKLGIKTKIFLVRFYLVILEKTLVKL